MKRFLLFSLFFIATNFSVFAQTEDEAHYSGCHLAKRDLIAGLNAVADNFYDFNSRSDTFDVINYDIQLDATDFAGAKIYGTTTILFKAKKDGLTSINFDLEVLTVDKVTGAAGQPLVFSHIGTWLNISLPATMNTGDETSVSIKYHGKPKTCACNFGGFYFENGIAYNLGIGLTEIPPNNGRTWFPCFDSFAERATYDLHVRSNAGRRAYCSGDFLGETALGGDTILRNYRMNIQLPTYLLGVAIGNYSVITDSYTGSYGTHPIEIVCKPAQVNNAKASLSKLDDAIAAFEAWYGPYVWGRIGYVGTSKGAMEHSNNIAYPDFAFDGTQNNAGLMAHEFAHHWWGNISGPNLPIDMWIKEGGAEYGHHLFLEKAYDRATFEKKCRDNTKFVMRQAHKDDNGYLALSPMPQPQTYGTHTYNKGALVYHNIRGYLGDTLYKYAMTAILDSFHFKDMSAQQFRDALTKFSGIDMTPFFDAWIFNPGYPTFEIDSVKMSGNSAQLFIQQKGHHLPIFHKKVPLQAVFYDKNWQRFETIVEADGEFSTPTAVLPNNFEPVWSYLNENQKLNYGTFSTKKTYNSTTNSLETLPAVDFQIRVKGLPAGDSAFVQIDHHWGAADPVNNPPAGFHISKNHYWRVGGIWPAGFNAEGALNYNGTSNNSFLDADLVANTEDSIRLVWRPRPGEAWREYPFYSKLLVGATNGYGVMRIDSILMGDYAFANGELPTVTATGEAEKDVFSLKIFPNPATDFIQIESQNLTKSGAAFCEILDAKGALIRREMMDVFSTKTLKINDLASGNYFIRLLDGQGVLLQNGKFAKQ